MSKQRDAVQEIKKLHKLHKNCLISAVLLFFVVAAGGVWGHEMHRHAKFQSTIKMGDTCYEENDFLHAAANYEKALSYPYQIDEKVVLRLADTYMKLVRLEDAANLLQDFEEKKPTEKCKHLVEQIVEQILNEQYCEHMERGQRYEQQELYLRAVQEYMDAYRLDQTNQKAVNKIISMYLHSEEIEKAQDFLSHLQNTEEIEKLKKLIETESKKKKYGALITEAKDLFVNEGYDECFKTLNKAITLMPKCVDAYQEMIDAHIQLEKYDEAIEAIAAYKKKYDYKELSELESYVWSKKKQQENLTVLLGKLYNSFAAGDDEGVLKIVHSKDYQSWIEDGTTYYYCYWKQKRVDQIPEKKGLIIYGTGSIYCGELENGQRNGKGRYFGLTKDILGYFMYFGRWVDDKPNGEGSLHTVMDLPIGNGQKQFEVKVHGTYRNGIENGYIKRRFYQKGEYYGMVIYRCLNGIPQGRELDRITYEWSGVYPYIIGELSTVNGTSEFYYNHDKRLWGVPE